LIAIYLEDASHVKLQTRISSAGAQLRLLLLCAGAVSAAPITYTFTGSGTGTEGGTAFTGANFVITLSGNTSQVGNQGIFGFGVTPIPAQINISGVGTTSFTGETFLLEYQLNTTTYGFDFGETNSGPLGGAPGNLIELDSTVLFQYDMISNKTDSGPNVYLPQFVNANTAAGQLTYTSMSNVTFQAVVGSTSATPEPASVGCVTLGLAGLCLHARKHRTAAVHPTK